MALIKFETQKGATSIRATDLDKNFEQLQPVNNGTYGINQDAGGWSLNIFPPFPETATRMLSLVYHNGGLQWRDIDQIGENSGLVFVPPTPVDTDRLVVVIWRPAEEGDSPSVINGDVSNTVEDYRSVPELLEELTDEEKLNFINALLATLDSDNGGVTLREVERCDGKRMKVLGTLWYDP